VVRAPARTTGERRRPFNSHPGRVQAGARGSFRTVLALRHPRSAAAEDLRLQAGQRLVGDLQLDGAHGIPALVGSRRLWVDSTRTAQRFSGAGRIVVPAASRARLEGSPTSSGDDGRPAGPLSRDSLPQRLFHLGTAPFCTVRNVTVPRTSRFCTVRNADVRRALRERHRARNRCTACIGVARRARRRCTRVSHKFSRKTRFSCGFRRRPR